MRFIAVLIIPLLFSSLSVAANKYDYVPGEVLVQFKSSATQKPRNHVRQKSGATLKAAYQHLEVEHWQLTKDSSVEEVVAALAQDPSVAVVEPNYRRYPATASRAIPVENSTYYDNQKLPFEQIRLPQLWDYVRGDPGVIVAVLDDAFDIQHQDLAANVIYPYDFVDNDNDPSPGVCVDPDTGFSIPEHHGTTVAGIVGAHTNNGTGIAGAAWNVSIMPLRIGCLYSVAAEVAALDYAIRNGAHIINASYGGPMYSVIEYNAIDKLRDKDILLVTAAGNRDVNNDKIRDYPSGIDLPNVIAVAASDGVSALTAWSQYGTTSVDVAAPGLSFYTTTVNSTYGQVSGGTSYSAPLVASVAALLKSAQPALDFRSLKGAILGGVTPLNNGKGRLVSEGQIDAVSAYNYAMRVNKTPVFSIVDVSIDDASGNGNGRLDEGENIRLKVTLENSGIDSNNISFSLLSDALIQPVQAAEIASTLYTGELITVTFDLGELVISDPAFHEIPFTLRFEAYTEAGFSSVEKGFFIDSGGLKSGVSVTGKVKKTGDIFDDIHFYHIEVPRNTSRLEVDLKLTDERLNTDVHFVLNYGDYPQFDYADYDESWGLSDSAMLSDLPGDDSLIVTKPASGTWYIAVFSPRQQQYPAVQYSLKARTVKSKSGGGFFLATGPFELLSGLFVVLFMTFLRLFSLRAKVTP